MNAYLVTRAAVRFVALTTALAGAYILAHVLATLPLLVMGL